MFDHNKTDHRYPFRTHTLRLVSAGILVMAVALVLSGPVHASSSPTFSGIVKDTIGNVVNGVEILVVLPGTGPDPVAVSRSNRQGRFEVANLLPGDYQVAMLKEGYLTLIASVNTRLQQVMQVVLQPALASSGSEIRPGELSDEWVLRLPRRSLLHDVDAPLGADQSHSGPSERPATLEMTLEQTISVKGGANGRTGNGTRVQLASPVGQRGTVALTGFQESLGDSSGSASASRRTGDSGVALSLDYQATMNSQVAVNAFYAGQEYGADLGRQLPGSRDRPMQRTWGYDARWSQQLDAASRLDLSVDYVGTQADEAPVASGLQMPGDTNHSIRAAGAYAHMSRQNELQVAFHARALRTPADLIYGVATPALLGVDGWTLGVDAQDTRLLGGAFSLIYGGGYQHALADGDTSLIAPRVGGLWNYGRFNLETQISYYKVAEWSDRRDDLEPLFANSHHFGYKIGLEVPVASRMTLQAGTTFSPSQMNRIGYDGGLEGPPNPLYLTNGNAAVRESRLALVQDGGTVRAIVELEHGWADGTLAAWLPEELPIRRLEDRRIQYDSGQIGIHVVPSGTDILVDFRRSRESASADALTAGVLEQRAMELRVRQRVLQALTSGDWQLLMAIRVSDLDVEDRSDELVGIHRRVSAGLSVQF